MTGLIVLLIVLAAVAWVVLGFFTNDDVPEQPKEAFDWNLAPDLQPVRDERKRQAERDAKWAEHVKGLH